MSTPKYPTSVHLVLLLALAVGLIACGPDDARDVDQLVHDGPIVEPRPPRPIALERSSAELVRFSPHDGELSSRLPEVAGAVIDATTDGQVVWLITATSTSHRVIAVDADGVAWERSVPDASDLAAIGEGCVAVFAAGDWWGLGRRGGVLWGAPGRRPLQILETSQGTLVVTSAGSRRSLFQLTSRSAEFVGSYPVQDGLLAPSGGELLSLSLASGALTVRSLTEAWEATLVLDAEGLLDAQPLPQRDDGPPAPLALLLRDPPTLALLTADGTLIQRPLPAPIEVPQSSGGGLLAVHHDRLFVATEAGVEAFDVTRARNRGDRNGVTLSPVEAFDGTGLGAPLSSPKDPFPRD